MRKLELKWPSETYFFDINFTNFRRFLDKSRDSHWGDEWAQTEPLNEVFLPIIMARVFETTVTNGNQGDVHFYKHMNSSQAQS